MELRDYQKECVDILDRIEFGAHICSMATGLGKSLVFANLKRKGRTLILSHRDELVRQPEKYYDCSFGIEKADTCSNGEEVVSASVQTLYHKSRLEKFEPDAFDTIIVDEAHHCTSKNVTYANILNYFHPRRVLGFTATVRRGDNVRLDDVFQDIVFSKDTLWGINNHWLCPVHGIRIMTNADISSVHKVAGDFNEKELNQCLENSDTVIKTASAYMQHCHNKRQTLIYGPSIIICTALLVAIRELLPDDDKESIQMITGKTDKDVRRKILDDYKNGKVKCIVNCMVLTEGFDAPETSAVIVMRPTCNNSLYQQIVGRGLRLSENKDKENCLVLDIVPSGSNYKHSICSVLSLFGEDAMLVPKSKRQQMESEFDVLQIIDEIKGTMEKIGAKSDIRSIALIQEEFDIFEEQEKERIINGEEYDIPKELTGLHVHINASSAERYRILIDYNTKVTLSEVDIMGNTEIRIITYDKIYNKNMRIEDAADFIRKLCVVKNEIPFLWDEDVHKEWERTPATDKQLAKIQRINKDRDIDIPLSKAQASDLIDLNLEMNKKRANMKDRKIIFNPVKSEKRQKQKEKDALNAYNEYMMEMHKKLESGAEEFETYKNQVEKVYKKKAVLIELEKKRKQKLIEEWKLEEPKTLSYKNVSEYYLDSSKHPSDRQINFITNLLSQLKLQAVHFEYPLKIKTFADASRAISMLMYLKREIPSAVWREKNDVAKYITISNRSFEEAFQTDSEYVTNAEIVLFADDGILDS